MKAKKPAKQLPEGMIGTSEVATKLKINPKELRAVLRKAGEGSDGKRYAWKENDPFLAKLPALISEHRLREKKIVKIEPLKKDKKK